MRQFITINQRAFIKLSNMTKTKFDLADVVIFEYISKFAISNHSIKKLIDNKIFVWCTYKKIIDDNPLLNIENKRVLERRISKLVETGLLEKYVDKLQGNKTFFNVTDLAFNSIIDFQN